MDNFSNKPRRADEGYVVKTNYSNSQKIKYIMIFIKKLIVLLKNLTVLEHYMHAYTLSSNDTYLIVK